jgi:hypothetical protein
LAGSLTVTQIFLLFYTLLLGGGELWSCEGHASTSCKAALCPSLSAPFTAQAS